MPVRLFSHHPNALLHCEMISADPQRRSPRPAGIAGGAALSGLRVVFPPSAHCTLLCKSHSVGGGECAPPGVSSTGQPAGATLVSMHACPASIRPDLAPGAMADEPLQGAHPGTGYCAPLRDGHAQILYARAAACGSHAGDAARSAELAAPLRDLQYAMHM